MTGRRLLPLALAAALPLAACDLLGPKDTIAVIDGRVTDAATGRPVEGLSVAAYFRSDSFWHTTPYEEDETDADGRYRLPVGLAGQSPFGEWRDGIPYRFGHWRVVAGREGDGSGFAPDSAETQRGFDSTVHFRLRRTVDGR